MIAYLCVNMFTLFNRFILLGLISIKNSVYCLHLNRQKTESNNLKNKRLKISKTLLSQYTTNVLLLFFCTEQPDLHKQHNTYLVSVYRLDVVEKFY